MDWNETPAELARAWAEQPVIMPGQHGDLYGIFTPPAPDASPAGLCVILFGRNRWRADRLSIKGARWLAARGFPCLRFDYHGLGESEGICQTIHGDNPFREDAVAAIRYMRSEFGQQRFALSGFCFDGRTALSATEEEGDAIEAVACISPEVTELPGERFTHLLSFERARTFLRTSGSYKKIAIIRGLRRVINLIKLASNSHPGEGLAERLVSMNFKREFQALVHSKARCLFLQGHEDAQYDTFQLVEQTLLAKLTPEQRARITVEVWPGKIHPLENPGTMRKVTERTLSWIDGCRERPFIGAQSAPSVVVPPLINGART